MEDRLPRKLAAILYADVAGYSRLTGEDEDATHRTLSAYLDLISITIESHHGQVMHYAGDAVLAKFDAVADAMSSAVAIQDELNTRNADHPIERQVEFRIGVNLGDVIEDRSDIYGDGVNVAARLESLADPGGICVSDAVRTAAGKKLDLDYEDMGEQKVKNIAEPVRAYRVVIEEKKEPATTATDPSTLELPDKPSIAVLPFTNMSGDPEQEYFADGIAEDIITALSRLRWFLVIARNSTFVYKGKAVDIRQVAKELDVEYVLEGSVRKVGGRVRVTAQLIDVMNGAHLWAERYDRDLTDIFELQDEITQSVTAAIEPKLVAAEGIHCQSRSADDLGAWQLVTRAIDHYGRMTTNESDKAIELLRQAVRQYPDYAPAHSMLAFMLVVSGHVGWIPENDNYDYATELTVKASEFAHRAVELDPEDPWAHLALGYLAFTDRRTEETVREYMRAIELNPNFATAYGYLGWAYVFDGQSEKALGYFQQAIRMSPHDPLIAFFYSGTGVAHYYAHRYEQAIEWTGKAIRERPGFAAAQRIYCASLAQAGKTNETQVAVARLRTMQPNISIEWIEERVPYTARAMPHFLDGMRKAGID